MLTFDEMMGVKLCLAVYSQMKKNNAGKQFFTGMYNGKTLGKVYNCFFPETILQRFWYYMSAHNLGTQTEGLHKLVPVTKGKLFASYQNC